MSPTITRRTDRQARPVRAARPLRAGTTRRPLGAWLFLAPSALVLVLVGVIPLSINAWHSLFDIFTLQSKFWVGADWYEAILSSPRFYESLGRSLAFSAVVLAVQFPLGLAIALILPRSGLIRSVWLVLLAVPLLVPWNMIPAMWISLIDADSGILGQLLVRAGLEFDWKFNALHTWILLVAMDTWHWVGLVAILSCAGLATVQPSIYQAAAIDRASRLQVFWFVELPALRGVLAMALLLRFMDSFMIYTEAFGLNAGGPNGATTFLSLDLGEEIKAFNYGPAAARSVVYFIITLAIAIAFARIITKENDAARGASG